MKKRVKMSYFMANSIHHENYNNHRCSYLLWKETYRLILTVFLTFQFISEIKKKAVISKKKNICFPWTFSLQLCFNVTFSSITFDIPIISPFFA